MKKMSMANGLATGQEWVSKKNVQAWETLFGKELIRPMINPDDLERDMNKLRNLFKQVKCISCKKLPTYFVGGTPFSTLLIFKY